MEGVISSNSPLGRLRDFSRIIWPKQSSCYSHHKWAHPQDFLGLVNGTIIHLVTQAINLGISLVGNDMVVKSYKAYGF